MTSAMAALGIAVAATSAICFALLTRAEKIRRNRRPAGDNPTDGGGYSGSDGWADRQLVRRPSFGDRQFGQSERFQRRR